MSHSSLNQLLATWYNKMRLDFLTHIEKIITYECIIRSGSRHWADQPAMLLIFIEKESTKCYN